MRATLSWMMTGLILMSGAVMAQTPQDPAFAGIELTFTSADLRSAMTESEQEEFAETRRKLRELKQTSEDPGAKESVREAADAYGRILREQFEQDFGYYRGFVGKTVTVYGFPIPTKSEIMQSVLSERFADREGLLYPHWKREDSALVGLTSPPDMSGSGIPAGPEASARASLDVDADVPAHAADDQGGDCGPVPSDWNYDFYGQPVCKCFDNATVLGVTPCNWVRSQ